MDTAGQPEKGGKLATVVEKLASKQLEAPPLPTTGKALVENEKTPQLSGAPSPTQMTSLAEEWQQQRERALVDVETDGRLRATLLAKGRQALRERLYVGVEQVERHAAMVQALVKERRESALLGAAPKDWTPTPYQRQSMQLHLLRSVGRENRQLKATVVELQASLKRRQDEAEAAIGDAKRLRLDLDAARSAVVDRDTTIAKMLNEASDRALELDARNRQEEALRETIAQLESRLADVTAEAKRRQAAHSSATIDKEQSTKEQPSPTPSLDAVWPPHAKRRPISRNVMTSPGYSESRDGYPGLPVSGSVEKNRGFRLCNGYVIYFD